MCSLCKGSRRQQGVTLRRLFSHESRSQLEMRAAIAGIPVTGKTTDQIVADLIAHKLASR